MAYEQQESRSSRVVAETPTSRREVTQTDAVRRPDRDGISGATVGVIVVVAIALATVVVLLFMNRQADEDVNANLAAQASQTPPQTTIVQQPAQQPPPVIIQQAPPAPAQAPIVINQPSASGSNDSAIQLEIDKRIDNDPTYSKLGLTVTVIDGKATVTGTVKSDSLKSQVEKMIRSVRGVKDVDNQIIVSG